MHGWRAGSSGAAYSSLLRLAKTKIDVETEAKIIFG